MSHCTFVYTCMCVAGVAGTAAGEQYTADAYDRMEDDEDQVPGKPAEEEEKEKDEQSQGEGEEDEQSQGEEEEKGKEVESVYEESSEDEESLQDD